MLVAAFTFACDRFEKLTNGFPTPTPETTTPTKQLANLELKPDAELEKQIAAIATQAKGKVGVAAIVLETGDSVSLNADQHFPMQSVYKLPIAMAVLHEVDDEKLTLDEQIGVTKLDFVREGQYSPIRDKNPNGAVLTVRELIQYTICESDGTGSDVLLRLAGGADAVQNYLAAIGVGKQLVVVNSEKELGQNWQTQYDNWTTPNTAVALLRDLQQGNGISPEHRELLLKFMTDSTTGPKRLKGLLPPGTAVAHKTSTSGTQNGITAATNDIGIITLPNGKHIAIAVFVSDSPADKKTREAVIAKIAKGVWDRWNYDSPVNTSQVKKIKCAESRDADDKNICDVIIPPAYREDTVSMDGFEVTVKEVDLKGDKKNEKIVWESSWAGTSGGELWVLEHFKGNYRKLFETEMTWTPIIILNTSHNGWRDFAYLLTGGGVDPEFITVRNDGKSYKAGGGKSYKRKDGQLDQPAGEVLIGKDWNQSILGPIPNN